MSKIGNALLTTTMVVGAAVAIAGGSAFAADAVRPIASAPFAPAWTSTPYVSVFGGLALANDPSGQYSSDEWFQVPTNMGYLFGAAIGGYITPNLRGEVELSYVHHGVTGTMSIDGDSSETDSGSFNTLYALGNIWYDIHPGSHITPYVGGGAGLAVVMPRVTNIYDDGIDYQYVTDAYAPAVQLGVGFRVPVTDMMMLDVGYRAKAVFNATLQESGADGDTPASGVSYIDQTFQAGLTFTW